MKSASGYKNPEKATVSYVGDGDSAWLKRQDGSSIECRIDAIDAPETQHGDRPGQTFGEEAKKTLQDMILNKEVTLSISLAKDRPRNGQPSPRSICKLEIEGNNVSKSMIEKGAAWLLEKYVRDPMMLMEFKGAQNKAKQNRVGLWADDNPQHPEKFKIQEWYRKGK